MSIGPDMQSLAISFIELSNREKSFFDASETTDPKGLRIQIEELEKALSSIREQIKLRDYAI
jgi:hypothetical protein